MHGVRLSRGPHPPRPPGRRRDPGRRGAMRARWWREEGHHPRPVTGDLAKEGAPERGRTGALKVDGGLVAAELEAGDVVLGDAVRVRRVLRLLAGIDHSCRA